MSDIEKIINDAWEIKDRINKDSEKDFIDLKIKSLSGFLKEINILKAAQYYE